MIRLNNHVVTTVSDQWGLIQSSVFKFILQDHKAPIWDNNMPSELKYSPTTISKSIYARNSCMHVAISHYQDLMLVYVIAIGPCITLFKKCNYYILFSTLWLKKNILKEDYIIQIGNLRLNQKWF